MDPVTLDTVRETRMGGQIRSNTFAAHYRVVTEHRQQAQRHSGSTTSSSSAAGAAGDGAQVAGGSSGSTSTSKRLVTFSNEFGFTGAKALFYEFDEAGKLIHETEHALQVKRDREGSSSCRKAPLGGTRPTSRGGPNSSWQAMWRCT